MKRYKRLTIEEHSYPNPYGVYDVEITRRNGSSRFVTREYQITDDRAARIKTIVGDRFEVEFEGGLIKLEFYAFTEAQP